MSRHKSYGRSGRGEQKRNVLKRYERIDVLRKSSKWKDEEQKSVLGLPKTKSS